MTLGAILSTKYRALFRERGPPCCVALRNFFSSPGSRLLHLQRWDCSVLAPRPGNTTQASDEAPPLLLVASKFVPACVGEGLGPQLLKYCLRT